MKKNRKILNLKSEAGLSIIEMLAAIGIFSFLLLISADSFWSATKSLQSQDKNISQLRIFQNLIYMMGMPAATRSALENAGPNSDIWICVRGKIGSNCSTGTIRDIVLYLPPITSDGTSIVTSGPISGPPSNPLRYNFDGEICDPSANPCPPEQYPISVSTQFDAICPPAYDQTYGVWPVGKPINPDGLVIPTTCHIAHFIKIMYKFEPTPGAPSEMSFNTITGTLYVDAVMMRLER